MSLVLGSVGDLLIARAELDGWRLAFATAAGGTDVCQRAAWPRGILGSPEGMTALLQVEMLVEMDLGEARGGELLVPWSKFGEVLSLQMSLPTRWTEWSPYLLSIGSTSEIGRPDFKYEYEYRLGNAPIAVDRCGYFVRRRVTGQVFHLDPDAFALVDAMDQFNAASVEQRKANGWSTLASVKGAALPIGAVLNEYLEFNDVLVPSDLSLDAYEHEDGSLSFVPKCSNVRAAEFRKAFLRQSDVPDVYSIDEEDGRRVRLLIGSRHREVLKRMKQGGRMRGAEKELAIRQPERFFDGLLDAVTIEYGPRVIGIGDYQFTSTPSDPRQTGGFFEKDGPAAPKTDDQPAPGSPPPVESPASPSQVEMPGPEGSGAVLLKFTDKLSVDAACDAMAQALSAGAKTVNIAGQEVEVSQDALNTLSRGPDPSGSRKDGRKYLLVYTNETEVRQSDAQAALAASAAPGIPALTLPRSIDPAITLMPHQESGVSWMLQCDATRPERTGILLADDMGLGKTLQVLAYLAALMEGGRLPVERRPDGTDRFRPFLIVAPLILVENETWVREIRRSFAGEGSAFDPILVLHGRGIDAVRATGRSGRETVVGQPMLDIEKLNSYRTVVTTYETAVSYQHSLAQTRDGQPLWSVLVTDEAQRYKAPDTKVSHAIKAIASAAAFRIASTGTPVENRLLDLWNIVDSTVQTALLGDRQAFSTEFEKPVAAGNIQEALDRLRRRLLFGERHAFVLRRSKEDVLELPKKTEVVLLAEMSQDECSMHAALLATLDAEHQRGRHLAVLHQLAQLYQHPALLRGNPSAISTDDLLAQSGKLRAVMAKLKEIAAKGEKVIIFARLLAMQQVLSRVIEKEFGTRVPVINGTPSRDSGYDGSTAATGRARDARRGILDEFERRSGFSCLVLSPHVAGIGLTITAANHVVHYGRWWNPAVEAQATDRAYRIGQHRPVFVYLPILTYPAGSEGRTFDERLHALMERKTSLRHDFLCPDSDEDQNAEELCAGLQADVPDRPDSSTERSIEASDLRQLSPHQFEALAGAFFIAEGYSIVLTARSSDGGADIIARKEDDFLLVQAKHSRSGTPIDETAIGDVVGALDIYGRELRRDFRAMVVTNSVVAQAAIHESRRRGIDLLSSERFVERLKQCHVTLSAMAACEARRCSSFAQGVERARDMFQ